MESGESLHVAPSGDMFPQSRTEKMSPMHLEMLARGEHEVSWSLKPEFRTDIVVQHDTSPFARAAESTEQRATLPRVASCLCADASCVREPKSAGAAAGTAKAVPRAISHIATATARVASDRRGRRSIYKWWIPF